MLARTTMSAMDGLVSASEYVNFAKSLGHKAVGISDINSVQAFPELANSAKKAGIKPIFGVNLSSFRSKEELAILNSKENNLNHKLRDSTYIILDLETTGLSPIFNEIIEFGAIKMNGGEIVSREQFFIKPSSPLPKHITDLTNITEEMLEEKGISKEEGLKRILDFCGDSILVAHNAKFDLGFLNQKSIDYGLKSVNNLTIDTLWISRFLNPTAKRHSLERLAQRIGINYDPFISHRADYDAEILAKI